MSDIFTRKCKDCGKPIAFHRDDFTGIILFKDLYYHEECFKTLAAKRATKASSSPDWKKALDDNLVQLKKETAEALDYYIGRDDLWNHLLESYDINSVTSYMVKTIDQIVQGEYKGKSKPIPYREFAMCWIESQKGLDTIAANNAQLGKKMTGSQRVNYDMAIVVGRYPEWKKTKNQPQQSKQELPSMAIMDSTCLLKAKQPKQANQNKQTKRRDLSDIMNDILID